MGSMFWGGGIIWTTTIAAVIHPQVLEKLDKRKHSDDDILRFLMLEMLQGRPGGNANFALHVMKDISGRLWSPSRLGMAKTALPSRSISNPSAGCLRRDLKHIRQASKKDTPGTASRMGNGSVFILTTLASWAFRFHDISVKMMTCRTPPRRPSGARLPVAVIIYPLPALSTTLVALVKPSNTYIEEVARYMYIGLVSVVDDIASLSPMASTSSASRRSRKTGTHAAHYVS
ncbi:hypothetical protein FIBSPDRAFT_899351 [Athelia psychrophila]|uniref:Uncharacterized protein n=1 Tax=Athelia psychrophila TaxID=1759441 RepID=A0A165ZTA1_9AGAM|nr:hypothetical protein FIBSPDRAFT_899351 [Fibularhizoctonia sp. CBS 109695]